MANPTGKGVALRDWASPSYDPNTGRSVSSLSPMGLTAGGNHATGARQVPSINSNRNKGGGGDPGGFAQKGSISRGGSGDPYRNLTQASKGNLGSR